MYNKAIEVLNKFYDSGYVAYIVGGYPRDNLLGIKTNDIDICTNAKPKEIIEIFDAESFSNVTYGSIKIIYNGFLFDVTTFRKDIKYENNRKPIKIKYITDLKTDLLRRDFTINTMCIDKDGNLIDLLGAMKDLNKHVIKTVGNPRYKLKEDSLRILRAIRFAANLDFSIDGKTKHYIKKYGYLLKKLSNSRKREELDKILTAKNKEMGRELIIELGIDKNLGLVNLNDIVLCDDIIGIWSQLDTDCDYPFSKLEKETIKKIRALMNLEINKINVYRYGLYISTVVGSIKGMSYKEVNSIYDNLPIYAKSELNITAMDIKDVLKVEPDHNFKLILNDIEEKVVMGTLKNEHKVLLKYVKDNY